jgi:hypothetical protein
MNKTVSEEEWVDSRKALLKKDSSHPDSDEYENQQTVILETAVILFAPNEQQN